MVKPSGTAFLSTTSTRKKMRGARKKKVSPATNEGQKSKKSWIDETGGLNSAQKSASSGGSKNNNSSERTKKDTKENFVEGGNPESNANESMPNPSTMAKLSKSNKKRKKKTGLFGHRRRQRGQGLNAQGKLVGAAAAAHEQKKQKELNNQQRLAAVDNETKEADHLKNNPNIDGIKVSMKPAAVVEPMDAEVVSITTNTLIKSSTLTISNSGQTGQAEETIKIGGEEWRNQVAGGIAGQKRGRRGSFESGRGKLLHGAAAEAKKGKLMGAAAIKHATRLEQEEQKETSPVNSNRRSTEPRESMAMNLRSNDRLLRGARQMRSI